MSKIKIYLLSAAVVVALLVVFAVYNSIIYRTEISEFTLTASTADISGVAPDSHFILKTTAPLSVQVLEKYMKILPAMDFSVKKVEAASNTYEIIPKTELKSDQVYTISIEKGPLANHDFSWAYQIKAPFTITSSIPKNLGVDVPVNSGIELYFNRDNIVNPEKYIEMSPSTPGRFETTGNLVRFIPNNPFIEKTIYSIKIKAGLTSKDSSDPFNKEETIQFQTATSYRSGSSYIYFPREFYEFKPGTDAVLNVYAVRMTSVETSVYRFADAKSFINSVGKTQGSNSWARNYTNISQALSGKTAIFSGTLPIEQANYYSSIRLPQSLSAGFYAVVVSNGDDKAISWVQVNPVASFSALAGKKSLLWIKDISSSGGLSGVPIFFEDNEVGKTGADGVALFATPASLERQPNEPYYPNNRKFFVAKIPSGDLVIPVEGEYGAATSIDSTNKWWEYISFNKNIYLPTDTIRFWSILKARNGERGIDEMTVKLSDAYWVENQEDAIVYAETKSKVSEYGTVTGELNYSNLKPGYYEVTFFDSKGVRIARQSLSVSSYVVPAYKISVVPNKTAMFSGESVTFKVKAEFFDGTPVTNTSISYNTYDYSSNGKNSNGTITLDGLGQGSFEVNTKYEPSNSWPDYLRVIVRPTNAEEGQIESNSTVFLFGPHIFNEISRDQSESKVGFTVKTREVNPNLKGAQGRPYWSTEEYLGGPIAGAVTDVQIFEVIYLREQDGTGYDAINKLTYPIYKYSTEEHLISSPSIRADQNGLSQVSFAIEKNKTYKFAFSTIDPSGRIVTNMRYVYGGYSDREYYSSQDFDYYLNDINDSSSYKIGDKINLQLETGKGVVPLDSRDNYIFITVNNGNVEYKVQSMPQYNTTFRNEDVPNVGIWPGWFSGGRFHNSYLKNISFDANTRRLSIAITKDKSSYKPGDEVGLDIRVTDKSGNPVKAEVNLSALDEAVFSMDPDESDITNDLYRDIYSQLVIRTSNKPPYSGGGAEKGGGDGDAPRSNIQEMAFYKSVETDSAGFARVNFKLPDNITSWRLTSQAVTKDLYAGKNVSFIPVTLPFFIDATLNKTYLAGDELVLRLRSFGTAGANGSIIYSVTSPTLAFKKIEKIGGNSIDIPLGKLTAGNHEITVTAKSGTYSDSLVRRLDVRNSYFTKNTSDYYEGQKGLKIKKSASSIATGYTTLSFSSAGRGQLYDNLKSLSYEQGMRIDQDGSRLIATDILSKYFGEKTELPEFDSSKYQDYAGGLQLLPYSSNDLEITAFSAHLFTDSNSNFNRLTLKGYLTSSLSDEKADVSRIARALYGLTAFGEPVLIKIQRIKNDDNLTLKDKVFVALALDRIGSKEEAREYYRKMIKPTIVTKTPYKYIGGLKGDETLITTALVAVLSASLEEPESLGLGLYALDWNNNPKETTGNFERLLYLKNALPKLDSGSVSFSYKTRSQTGNKTLENGQSFELTLSQAELSSFELTDVKGKLGVTASYEVQVSQKVMFGTDMSLKRYYYVGDMGSGIMPDTSSLHDGDLVLVKLSPYFGIYALNGYYQIVDYLPSGLRPIDQESGRYYSGYGRVYPTEINDQKVTFIIEKSLTQPIYYYARVVSKGVYKAEPAILQSLKSLEDITTSDEATIKVK